MADVTFPTPGGPAPGPSNPGSSNPGAPGWSRGLGTRARAYLSDAVLRLDLLSLFSLWFALNIVFANIYVLAYQRDNPIAVWPTIFTTCAAFVLAANPWSMRLLFGVALIRFAQYVFVAPVSSNSFTLAAFMAGSVLVGLTFLLLRDGWRAGVDREAAVESFAPMARALLIGMYFFGIFHKINTDFLDVRVSCAVDLYAAIARPFGLAQWEFGRHAAIWTTFVVEGAALLALLSKRWKFWGFVIGVPFHIAIGLSGYAFYMDFSTAVLAIYALFLPPEYFRRLNAFFGMTHGAWPKWGRFFGRWALILTPVGLYALLTAIRVIRGHTWMYLPPVMILFAVISVAFYVSVLVFYPKEGWAARGTDLSRPSYRFAHWLLLLVPGLYFLNGFSPYLGFKTESSVAMYSNLHTEGGVTNHLMFPSPPYLFGYQRDLATIVSTDIPALTSFAGSSIQLVEYEVHRAAALNPGGSVTYTMNGRTFTGVPRAQNQYLKTHPAFRQLLTFKPVDWSRPKVCTH